MLSDQWAALVHPPLIRTPLAIPLNASPTFARPPPQSHSLVILPLLLPPTPSLILFQVPPQQPEFGRKRGNRALGCKGVLVSTVRAVSGYYENEATVGGLVCRVVKGEGVRRQVMVTVVLCSQQYPYHHQ